MPRSFVEKLRAELGPDGVLSAPADRLLYSYDAAQDKALPGAVALPRSAEQVAAAVRLARAARVPYVARGAGTNLCGGSVPAEDGLVIHLARLNRILSIDPVRRRATVEPGVVNLHLQNALRPHGLFYAPDPASQKACTLGGNVGTNAGGPHCLKHGVTTNHVSALRVVLPDGEMVRAAVDEAGYDVTGLFVGSEGTLGIVTEIEVRLLPLPGEVRTMLVAFPSIEAAVQAVTDVVSAGIVPTTLEVMDRVTVEAVEAFVHAGYPLGAEAVLLIEIDGDAGALEGDVARVLGLCKRNGGGDAQVAKDEKERARLWEGRRGSYPAMARLAPNVLVEDGVVPRTRLAEAVKRVRAIAARDGLRMGLIAHAGDGNLHPNMIFDERDPEQTRKVKAAGYEMLKVCVDLGGSISGEHGIGVDKREAMRWLFTPSTLAAFRRVKDAFDPEHLCNPDKLIPAPPPPASPVQERGDGVWIAAPSSVAEVQRSMAWAQREKKAVLIRGSASKAGSDAAGALTLRLDGLKALVDHDRGNFTLTVQAGMDMKALHAAAASAAQFVHVDGAGTIGGVLSTRACLSPALRDQVIGLKAVLADGSLAEFGGKVMKNVAGYDALKLFIGAWGTLGAVVEVTLRLFPAPFAGAVTLSPPDDFAWAASPLHRRVKRAFDPENRLNPAVFR